jgi:hypothetical protein
MTSITGTIAALTGEETIWVLADTADYQDRLPDVLVATPREFESRILRAA